MCVCVRAVPPRSVPFEVRVQGEKEPIYDFTLEDLGRFNEQPVLPFNAYGTLAWARAEFDNNSASSQASAGARVVSPALGAQSSDAWAWQAGMMPGSLAQALCAWSKDRHGVDIIALCWGRPDVAGAALRCALRSGVLPAEGERADAQRLQPAGRPLRRVWLHHAGPGRAVQLQGRGGCMTLATR